MNNIWSLILVVLFGFLAFVLVGSGLAGLLLEAVFGLLSWIVVTFAAALPFVLVGVIIIILFRIIFH